MEFRSDINALRAISVIAVIIFHFYPALLPGGFAGVDIFFVISGFLMTKIIASSLATNSFSFSSFYLSRIKRILPALSVLCLSMLAIGWFQLGPDALTTLAKHAVGAVTFVSNVMFWHESGYFDQASSEKWLLHTWSLSVEWQFYLLFPVFLALVCKFVSLNKLKYVLLFFAAASFWLSLKLGQQSPELNFYLLPSRLWEFMLGGCVWLYTRERNPAAGSKWLQWTGILLMLGAFMLPGTSIHWPGIVTLLPVSGALLFILANHSENILMEQPLLQKVGRWSYSIYLWHWPVAIWFDSASTGSYSGIIGILLSVFLGCISYQLFEKRRKKKKDAVVAKDFITSKSLQFPVIMALLGSIIYVNQGFPSRFKLAEDLKVLVKNRQDAEQIYRQSWKENQNNRAISLCVLDNKKKSLEDVLDCLAQGFEHEGFLIIGDSHGRDFLNALNIAYPETKFSMLYQSSCAPAAYNLGASSTRDCFNMLDDINRLFIQNNEKIKGIIFASAFLDETGLDAFIRDLEEEVYADVPIYVSTIGPMLNVPVVELVTQVGSLQTTYTLGSSNDKVMSKNEKLHQLSDKVKVFDKHAVFCEKDECELLRNKYPYFWDTSHLSQRGIEKLAESLKQQVFLAS
ncbi:acyltransferase family protein [Alteromonas halophila]|uniref:Acyltransferase n=1 Tax=Alteromonas halophila TaxID=516698 RepID=A0A918JKP2_9ALTE|nr:acyltransferase family protein [Alteromonas halophila]GGW80667.1 acyltransferase [Alteromonas halophila]